jgi:release factor glutamine methyltransferase
VLGQSRAWLFAWPEFQVPEAHAERFVQLIEARLRGEPIAYLIGRRAFWSLELDVAPGVLIPRPETELLVELALARMPVDARSTVADLGTGSGAIALSLARERPHAQVLGTDASSEALAIARANAQRLAIVNVAFAQGDWCEALGHARFDLIVSNPPYIEQGDPHLVEGDLRFEPLSALASGADGLDAIRRIVADASRHLNPDGALLLEHGWDQAMRVRALLHEGSFVAIETVRDSAGHERITLARTDS